MTNAWDPWGETLLIVTGSTLRAEEVDRPLAYYLRECIHNHHHSEMPIFVISDVRYLHEEALAELPVISIGGPGVNAVAHKWLETLPALLAVDCEFYLQMTDDGCRPARASVWGMDHAATRRAVSTFVDGHLERFLSFCGDPARPI